MEKAEAIDFQKLNVAGAITIPARIRAVTPTALSHALIASIQDCLKIPLATLKAVVRCCRRNHFRAAPDPAEKPDRNTFDNSSCIRHVAFKRMALGRAPLIAISRDAAGSCGLAPGTPRISVLQKSRPLPPCRKSSAACSPPEVLQCAFRAWPDSASERKTGTARRAVTSIP